MKIVPRYAKKYAFPLFLALLFIVGQCLTDLNLPNFMSKIVNVGVQQYGIERAAPDAMTPESLGFLQMFLSPEDARLMAESYTLTNTAETDPNDKRKRTYAERFERAGEQIYALNTTDEETLNQIDRAMGLGAWTFFNLLESIAPEGSSPMGGGDSDEATELNMEQIAEMMPMLAQLPQQAYTEAREKAEGMDSMMLEASGVLLARAFYQQAGLDLAGLQRDSILEVGFWMLLLALGGGVATVTVGFIMSRTASAISRNMRGDIFKKVASFSNAEFDKFSTASLITRTTNDINHVQMLIMMGLRFLTMSPIMAVGGVVMAIQKSTSMSWLIALACLVLLCVMGLVFVLAMPKFKMMQKLIDKLNQVSRESLTGLLVIRAFGTQKHELERFDKANEDVTKTNLFIGRVMSSMFPIIGLIMNGMSIMIIWLGSHQIATSAMQIGDMIAFTQYAMQIVMSFMMIAMMFIMVPRAAVSAERIREVLDTKPSIVDPAQPQSFDPQQSGIVRFDNVSFRYPGAGEDTLKNISFTARPGQTTAIIGSTGSGKSTLIHLLMRFYDITGGSLTVDGAEVSQVKQTDLRARIGFVPQKGVLMSGDIRSNIGYGAPKASDEELLQAASVAQAADFIAEREKGLDDAISQGGTNVSGGQKQRLSIARALAKNPEILIFDDSFSALDFKTDLALRRALKEHTANAAILVVAQRVNTIQNAEQIIVLEQGEIVGIGTHRELLKSCKEYLEIASSQLSEEELA